MIERKGIQYKNEEIHSISIRAQLTDAARLPIFELAMERGRDSSQQHPSETQQHENVEPARAHMREGIPPPLCAGRVCAAPPAGPVCAFDAAGTARTFKTICELEAVSCRESTPHQKKYYIKNTMFDEGGECVTRILRHRTKRNSGNCYFTYVFYENVVSHLFVLQPN
ncbi:hypothetical protein EVAR_84771_1 [Eumeta japonica]|uniref:Kazal-like domain-containing protein n=1 Tax=Eumeta variegata TaxID=151549 RepID=A0A4C1U9C9_EUMVA|nr:hypothetical protein EVAR_84771_1 [Eumeta japonica]